jgi:hypothetical protein
VYVAPARDAESQVDEPTVIVGELRAEKTETDAGETVSGSHPLMAALLFASPL